MCVDPVDIGDPGLISRGDRGLTYCSRVSCFELTQQIGKGADEWDGFPGERGAAGTQDDHGVRWVKHANDTV